MSFFRCKRLPPRCARCGKTLIWIDDPPVWVEIHLYDSTCGLTAEGVEYPHQVIRKPLPIQSTTLKETS